MNWFSGFLRGRRLKKIKAALGSRARYADALSNLEFSHLGLIARITRRVAAENQAAMWALDVALPELAANAALARTLDRSDRGRLNSELDRFVLERAKRIVESAAPALTRIAPGGCQINTDAVQRLAVQILRDGVQESGIGQRLSSGVSSSPQTYFDRYVVWVDGRASKIFESLRDQLRALAPPELELDDMKCLERLRNELRGKLSTAGVAEGFAAHFKANRSRFVRGYDEWLKNEAELIFEEVRPALAQNIPAEHQLKKEPCITELVGLLRKQLAREQIVEAIIKTVRARPTVFLEGYIESFIPAARKLFEELNTQLSSSFGGRDVLIRGSSIRTIATILASGVAPNAVMERFLEQIAKEPEQFVVGLQAAREFQSSSPYRSEPSGARFAR